MEEALSHYLDALHEMAEVTIDTNKPIRLYIRSAETVYRQACVYRSEKDLEKSFILFLKYSKYKPFIECSDLLTGSFSVYLS